MYAEPREARRTTSNQDVEMKPIVESSPKRENGNNKRSRHQMITAPTVETVTNACKKIRLINTEHTNSHKRQCEPSPMVCSFTNTFNFFYKTQFIFLVLGLCQSNKSAN